MSEESQKRVEEFADRFGEFFERSGMPRVAGRIWGWLLICDPPEQSAAQLAEAVHASLGSISTMTRTLMQFGLIERIGIRGERNRSYRIKEGSFTQLLRAKMALTAEVRRMAETGLALLGDAKPATRARLEECRDFYAFFEREFPALIRRWEEDRKA